MNRTKLPSALTRLLLESESKEIVLFGSRATGVGSKHSDWDVLLIGKCEIEDLDGVDLVVIPVERLSCPRWLGSELANHIAQFGRWLRGDGTWRRNVFISEEAIESKAQRILRRYRTLKETWPLIQTAYRRKFLIALRRDLQRHECLVAGRAVPPSPTLDATWLAQPTAESFRRSLGDQRLVAVTDLVLLEGVRASVVAELKHESDEDGGRSPQSA